MISKVVFVSSPKRPIAYPIRIFAEKSRRGDASSSNSIARSFSDSQFALNCNPQRVFEIRCEQKRGTSIVSVTASTNTHTAKSSENFLKIVYSFLQTAGPLCSTDIHMWRATDGPQPN